MHVLEENNDSLFIEAYGLSKDKAFLEIENLKKDLTELRDYERQTLYPSAIDRKEIDLDDGVKVNYRKFGKALKKVPGLS